jgi:hypothetical protein
MRKSYTWCWDTDSATWPLYQCREGEKKKKMLSTTVNFPFNSLNHILAVDIGLDDSHRMMNTTDNDIEKYVYFFYK